MQPQPNNQPPPQSQYPAEQLHHVLQQQAASLQQSQQPTRSQQVASVNQNPSGMLSMSLPSYAVPISGSLAHIPSSQVPSTNAMAGMVQRQQPPQHTLPGNSGTVSVVGHQGNMQHLMGNSGSHLRTGEAKGYGLCDATFSCPG